MSSSQQSSQQFFEEMEKQGIKIEPKYKNNIEKKLNELRNYVPKVGVFGKTGVGKSSLCNALFGQDVCEVSDVKACTRDPKEVLLSFGGKDTGLKLIDVPGVGESSERDKEYKELYDNLLPELDLIFWVFKSDDRADASNEIFYKEVLNRYVKAGKPFLAVINQVDKIEPFREWNESERRPGAKQAANIDIKRSHVAGLFDLPLTKVIPVSANEKYGLMELVDAIVHELPNEQKKIVLEKIKQAEDAKKKAEAEEAQAKAEKAKFEAEEAQARSEKARAGTAREIAEAKEAQAKAEKAKFEAKEAQARSERARNETIVSKKAEAEAEKGWVDTVIDTVIEYGGKAIAFISGFKFW